MTEVAPWWGVPVVAGSFLIIGGVLGFIFALIQIWLKHRREDRTQYRELLLEVVIDVLNALDVASENMIMPGDSEEQRTGKRNAIREGMDSAKERIQVFQLLLNVNDLYFDARRGIYWHHLYAVHAYADKASGPDGTESSQDILKNMKESRGIFLESASEVLGIR